MKLWWDKLNFGGLPYWRQLIANTVLYWLIKEKTVRYICNLIPGLQSISVVTAPSLFIACHLSQCHSTREKQKQRETIREGEKSHWVGLKG